MVIPRYDKIKARKKRCRLNNLEIAREVITTLEEKKAEDILFLDISEISGFTDFFIICTGTSGRMLESLADAVRETIRKISHTPARLEGRSEGGWLVLDIGDIVIHFFSPDQRKHYDLEQLWHLGKTRLRLA